MGFDLNNNKMTASGGLVVTTDIGNVVMKMATDGTLTRFNAGQPMFCAGGTATGWTGIGTDQWAVVTAWTTTNVNVAGCWNGSTSRFTVPVTGVYLVAAHSYVLINAAGNYMHPMFWVNGVANLRRAALGGLHRIRGHGIAGGYSVDGTIAEIIPLQAGDYVEYRNYCNGPVNHIPTHGRFEGYLLF
jgi:hypothetical protein